MRQLRAFAVGLALLAGSAWPAVGPAGPACAATAAHAGLVIDTGTEVLTYCVRLDASAVTGLHLIELAGEQHGLAYRFGMGGAAVCRLAGVGPRGDDCFADYPSYWGYWHGDGRGGWTWASTGAGSAQVRRGDMEGWAWGEGDDGTTHPAPPPRSFADVCPPPSPSPSPAPSPSPSPTGGPAPTATPTASRTPRSSPSGRSSAAPPTRETSAPNPLVVAPTAEMSPAGNDPAEGAGRGSPVGVLVGAAVASSLAAAGALRLRSRRAGGER